MTEKLNEQSILKRQDRNANYYMEYYKKILFNNELL